LRFTIHDLRAAKNANYARQSQIVNRKLPVRIQGNHHAARNRRRARKSPKNAWLFASKKIVKNALRIIAFPGVR
jgi:hypothetical protein